MSMRATALATAIALVTFSASGAIAAEVPGVVRELADRSREGTVPAEWLEEHVRPNGAAIADHGLQVWVHALRPNGPLAKTFAAGPAVAAVVEGPAYTRVVYDTVPPISVVSYQDGDAWFVDRVSVTECVECSEPERWARDLIAHVARRRRLDDRLIPHLDLHVDTWLRKHRSATHPQFRVAIERRNESDASLANTLAGATIDRVEGDSVFVQYPDGRQDSWYLHWIDGRWQLNYDRLAASSPIRVSAADQRQWRRRTHRIQKAMSSWRPSWGGGPAGALHVAHQAVDAHYDPREETIWVVLAEHDRILSGVVQLDPSSREVRSRYALTPPHPRRHLRVEPWASQWTSALSRDGRQLAVAGPFDVRTVTLATGQSVVTSRYRRIRHVAWRDEGRIAIADTAGTLWAHPRAQHERLGAPLVALQADGNALAAVTQDGQHLRVPHAPSAWSGSACGGDVRAAAHDPAHDAWLLVCGPDAGHAAERRARYVEDPTLIQGAGTAHSGAAWSPDGTLFAASGPGDSGGLRVWSADDNRLLHTVDTPPLRTLRWAPSGDTLLGVTTQGDVWLWNVAMLLRSRPPRS